MTGYKHKKPPVPIALALAACLGLSLATASASEPLSDHDHRIHHQVYVETVIGILRAHILAMRMLLDDDQLRYSDNVYRHAVAFERTFGMIGPMEWHAANAFKRASGPLANPELTEARFEQLGETSHQRIKELPLVAEQYLKNGDAASVHEAIDDMMASCGGCHSLLPQGYVPAVWRGMQR